MTYTPYKLKFSEYEFIALKHLEVKKAIYEHSYLQVEGVIRDADAENYQKKLDRDDPLIELTCLEDERKIIFKGIIEEYSLSYNRSMYELKLRAVSYSRLLEREEQNRIYQKQGATFSDIFTVIEKDHPEFNILFGDKKLNNRELISDDNPIVLQYSESNWVFLRRIITYAGQILIVDDTKDDSETINILAGEHDAPPVKLKYDQVVETKTVDSEGNDLKCYLIKNYCYSNQEEEGEEDDFERPIFELGTYLKYNFDNKGEENDSEEAKELVIIETRLFVKGDQLYSDFKLSEKGKYPLKKRRRVKKIAGCSLLAEIKDVRKDYRAQVEFINLDDDYSSSDAFYFPLERRYSGILFPPEKGDVVEVYFKNKYERCASIRCTSSDTIREKVSVEETEPETKLLFNPDGYQIEHTNEYICITDVEKEARYEITEKDVDIFLAGYYKDYFYRLFQLRKEIKKDEYEITKEGFEITVGKGEIRMEEEGLECVQGKYQFNIREDVIEIG